MILHIGNRLKLRVKRLHILLAVAVLLAAIDFLHAREKRRQGLYNAIISTLNYIENYKYLRAMEAKLTNGYPMKVSDFKPCDPEFASCLCDNEASANSASIRRVDWVYILNPIGVPAKARFIHGLYGYPAGTEISAHNVIGTDGNAANTVSKENLQFHPPK